MSTTVQHHPPRDTHGWMCDWGIHERNSQVSHRRTRWKSDVLGRRMEHQGAGPQRDSGAKVKWKHGAVMHA